MSLYRKMRPGSWVEMRGQEAAVAVLKSKCEPPFKDLPHAILFTGPTGTGKTTMARIVAAQLGCTAANWTLVEVNCADYRSIDDVREIRDNLARRPMHGSRLCYILDEVVQLPKPTQQAFLAYLEDTPDWCWFLLCSSDTTGLLPTFLGRCYVVKTQPLSAVALDGVLGSALLALGRVVTAKVRTVIVREAQGSARRALQLLEAALTATDEADQLTALAVGVHRDEEHQEFLGRLLLYNQSWDKIHKAVLALEEAAVESVRRQVLAYAAKCLTDKSPARVVKVLEALQYDFSQSGRAGLLLACRKAVS